MSDFDLDGDGHNDSADCAPEDPRIHPGVFDPIDPDGIDSNCDGSDGMDLDGDGFLAGLDCDDTRFDVFPGAEEVADDGTDQNCDGIDLQLAGFERCSGDVIYTLDKDFSNGAEGWDQPEDCPLESTPAGLVTTCASDEKLLLWETAVGECMEVSMRARFATPECESIRVTVINADNWHMSLEISSDQGGTGALHGNLQTFGAGLRFLADDTPRWAAFTANDEERAWLQGIADQNVIADGGLRVGGQVWIEMLGPAGACELNFLHLVISD